MTVMSGTIKGAGCSKGGPFMSGFGDFKNSDTAEMISTAAITEIDKLAAAG